jgi:hypothetical protein
VNTKCLNGHSGSGRDHVHRLEDPIEALSLSPVLPEESGRRPPSLAICTDLSEARTMYLAMVWFRAELPPAMSSSVRLLVR